MWKSPFIFDDTVQSVQCHPSAGDTAPLPGLSEKGRKESLTEHLGEGGRCTDQQVPIGRLLYAKPCAECSESCQGEEAAAGGASGSH